MVVTFADISQRKHAEEAMSLLASMVESSDDAIIGGRLDGTITTWNPGAERLYGWSAREMVGKNLALLVPPDHAEEGNQLFVQYMGDRYPVTVAVKGSRSLFDPENIRVRS